MKKRKKSFISIRNYYKRWSSRINNPTISLKFWKTEKKKKIASLVLLWPLKCCCNILTKFVILISVVCFCCEYSFLGCLDFFFSFSCFIFVDWSSLTRRNEGAPSIKPNHIRSQVKNHWKEMQVYRFMRLKSTTCLTYTHVYTSVYSYNKEYLRGRCQRKIKKYSAIKLISYIDTFNMSGKNKSQNYWRLTD